MACLDGLDGSSAGLAAPSEAAQQRSLVPLAGIEPALLAELDFESSASTSSATGALGRSPRLTSRSRRTIAGAQPRSTRATRVGYSKTPQCDRALPRQRRTRRIRGFHARR